jgi:hypothetical protein
MVGAPGSKNNDDGDEASFVPLTAAGAVLWVCVMFT